MRVLEEMQPLYFGDYMFCDLMGGRGGARSYSSTQHALHELLHAPFMRGFFLREIHSTIYASVWQDFKDRIAEYEEQHNTDLSRIIEFTDNKQGENYARNLINGNTITTKGFKVSSSGHTASLKSLASATHVYIEEAEETAKKEYTKLLLSLRKKDAKIKVIRSFNPPHRSHWIWEDYDLTKVSNEELKEIVYRTSSHPKNIIDVALRKIEDRTYFKATPKDKKRVLIFTNHYHNYQNLNTDALSLYDKLLVDDPHYYITTIIGYVANDSGDVVYYEYDPIRCHTDKRVSENASLHIGMDFNVGNMSAVIHEIEGDTAYALREITKVLDTQKMCEEIQRLYPGHKITIYPDASGRNKSTNSKRSDHDIIRSFGFKIITDLTNPAVRDRINVMNSQFRTGKYFVNRFECPEYSESLQKQKYKNGEPDKSQGYDHIPDAGGYFIHKAFSPRQKVKLKVSY